MLHNVLKVLLQVVSQIDTFISSGQPGAKDGNCQSSLLSGRSELPEGMLSTASRLSAICATLCHKDVLGNAHDGVTSTESSVAETFVILFFLSRFHGTGNREAFGIFHLIA